TGADCCPASSPPARECLARRRIGRASRSTSRPSGHGRRARCCRSRSYASRYALPRRALQAGGAGEVAAVALRARIGWRRSCALPLHGARVDDRREIVPRRAPFDLPMAHTLDGVHGAVELDLVTDERAPVQAGVELDLAVDRYLDFETAVDATHGRTAREKLRRVLVGGLLWLAFMADGLRCEG